MPVASDNELRWLLGKIVHCALSASSREEFEDCMNDVVVPEELLDLQPEEQREDCITNSATAAYVAACRLYGHRSNEEARAHEQIRSAFGRLQELPEKLASNQLPTHPGPIATAGNTASQNVDEELGDREIPVSHAARDAGGRAVQRIDAGRDVNAPIVNSAGGNVYINDRSHEIDRLLHDYLTFLIYLSFGVKRPHVTDGARDLLDAAMGALVGYHGKTRHGTIGNSPEIWRQAPMVYKTVDAACRTIFGLSFEESRPELFQSPLPSFPLFEQMTLIRGGYDPYTGMDVGPFYLSRFPVTVSQYAEFCHAMSYPPVPEWKAMAPPAELANHPVTGVNLFDSVVFCVWLESATGFRFRVATESEWCFAATGGARRKYPWGDQYVPGYAATQVEHPRGTFPVDSHPLGGTSGGIMDLVGNVWELTSTIFDERPDSHGMNFTFPPVMLALARSAWWETDRRIPRGAGPWQEAARFVMRGGSWGGGPEWAAMDRRIWTSMFNRGGYGGFRIACSAEPVGDGFVPSPSYLAGRFGAFADRIQLTNVDGSQAIAQKQFSACGSGTTWESGVTSELLEWAVTRYDSLDGVDLPLNHGEMASRIARSNGFPRLGVRVSTPGPSSPPVSADVWSRFDGRDGHTVSGEVRNAIEAAKREALTMGHRVVGTDHLLLGLMQVDGDMIGSSMLSFGLSVERSRQICEGSRSALPVTADQLAISEGAARALSADETPAYLGPEHVFRRIMEKPDVDVMRLLLSAQADGEAAIAAVSNVALAWRLLRIRDESPSHERLDAVLATLRRLHTVSPHTAIPMLAAVTTALVNTLEEEGQPAAEVQAAEDDAVQWRDALSATFVPTASMRSGLSQRLGRRSVLLFHKERYEDAARVLDEAIAIDKGGPDTDAELALAWAYLNKAVALNELDLVKEAFEANEHAVATYWGLARKAQGRRSRPPSAYLALALNNKATYLGGLQEPENAFLAIRMALQVALPTLQRWQRPVAPNVLNLEELEATYRKCCTVIGSSPDDAIVNRLRIMRTSTSGRFPSDLSAIDSCRVELVSLPVESENRCSFCGRRGPTIGGLTSCICRDCIDMTAEIFEERDVSDRIGVAEGTHDVACTMCGWAYSQRESVSEANAAICRDCHRRSVILVGGRGSDVP